MDSKEIEIAHRLKKGTPYNKICKELKVSTRLISQVSKKMKSGIINFDQSGHLVAVHAAQEEALKEAEELRPLLSNLVRISGSRNPEEALEKSIQMIIALNPYLLYSDIKDPADLIHRLERSIQALKNKVEAYDTEQGESLARRLGISESSLEFYEKTRGELGYSGSIGRFLNEAVEYMMLKAPQNSY